MEKNDQLSKSKIYSSALSENSCQVNLQREEEEVYNYTGLQSGQASKSCIKLSEIWKHFSSSWNPFHPVSGANWAEWRARTTRDKCSFKVGPLAHLCLWVRGARYHCTQHKKMRHHLISFTIKSEDKQEILPTGSKRGKQLKIGKLQFVECWQMCKNL